MHKKYGFLIGCVAVLLLVACNNDTETILADASVSIQNYTITDVIVNELPVLEDEIITVNVKAQLNNQTAKKDLHVRFAVDETKIYLYRNKYGDALLLPYKAYYFYKSNCHILKGETLSDDIELYIVQESLLRAYTTYVLPVVIQTVDGDTDGITPDEVMYIVLETGNADNISKAEWQVVSVSHEDGTLYGSNAIDDDTETNWGTSLFDSPPYSIVIDFSSEIAFSGVTCMPGSLTLGCPTQVQIELSDDGSTWEDVGTFDLEPAETQLIDTGINSAQYMRFTALEVVSYYGYTPLKLSEIGLEP